MKISEYEISVIDFKSTSSLCIRFPSDVSTDSRSSYNEVEWINYCPDVFRILQDYGKVDFDDYMTSICSQGTMRQILAHGKTSTFLRLSHDDRFVIQTITKSEIKVFLENLPGYYHYVRKYKNTLLTKFYGLHALKQAKSQKVYFVVMGNILHSDLHIHKHFNLKTTSQGRSSIDNGSTVEDELDIVFHLDRSTRNQLLVQLKHDCDFLEDMGIIDYTLLLGIHLSSPPTESLKRGSFTSSQPRSRGAYSPAESLGSSSPVQSPNNGSCSPVHLTGSEDGSEDDKSVSSQNGDPQSSSQDLQSDQDHNLPTADDLIQSPPHTIQPEEKLAVGLSACAIRKNLISRGKGKNNNVQLFFEITNILNQYTISKRVENVFKSLQFDSLASSPGNPKGYSNRFQDFVSQIFPEETEL